MLQLREEVEKGGGCALGLLTIYGCFTVLKDGYFQDFPKHIECFQMTSSLKEAIISMIISF